jgi:hypothetical protein
VLHAIDGTEESGRLEVPIQHGRTGVIRASSPCSMALRSMLCSARRR